MDRASNGETGATHLAAHAADAATYDFGQHPAGTGDVSSIVETSLQSDLNSQTPIVSQTLLAPVLSTSPMLPRRQSSLTRRSPEAPSLQGSEVEAGQGALSTRVSKMKAAEADLRRHFSLADGEVALLAPSTRLSCLAAGPLPSRSSPVRRRHPRSVAATPACSHTYTAGQSLNGAGWQWSRSWVRACCRGQHSTGHRTLLQLASLSAETAVAV